MEEAGIDTNKFTVHSIRSASSTKAVTMGSEIDQVKMHANWSLKSNTFENYYYKPRDQHKRGQEMVNKPFGDITENRTTSEVGVEPTTIVVGTTDNSNVDETKIKDVVTRPTFFSWLMNHK
jgi:hypothetical protein